MNTYIAILRGINVSGQKKIKMDILRHLMETLGYTNVQTYIQSGNIIFQTKKVEPQTLENKISSAILAEFGFEVPVLVKEKDELKKIIKLNPYLKDKSKDASFFHVTFLSTLPNKELVRKIQDGPYGEDEYQLLDKTIYLYCPGGYGKTKLTNNFFETKLKVMATTRNGKTVNELIAIVDKMYS